MKDPFGQAILDYIIHGKAKDIVVNSNYTEDETIPVSHFFREWKNMPLVEKRALELCRGTILDIGAAAGCHSLYLQKNGFDVCALEKSTLALEALRIRGVSKIIHNDIYRFANQKFDTLLLLMNGAGIGKTVNGLQGLLNHLKTLLNPNGQILIDSSDIKYLFEEEDGSVWINLNTEKYYGEMEYEISYKNHQDSFKWLFIDFDLLCIIAGAVGFNCRLIAEGQHFEYLAQLTRK